MNAIAINAVHSLNDLDWKVVDIGRLDGPRSINPDHFLARFARDFCGVPVARRLANERLEALRRFSVRAWYWDLVRIEDVSPLIDAGYTVPDVFRILAHVARYRGFTPSLQEGAI